MDVDRTPRTNYYTLDEYIDWAESLVRLMGEEWLSAHAPQPHRPVHIIASWILGYRNATPETLHQSQQLLQIGELMSNIRALENAGVQNLETRMNDLRLDDFERVSSAIHEIRVAAHYTLEGRRVFFIPEAGTRTPDMLIDDQVEVECKHKCSVSRQDKQRYELYGILSRRLRSAFHDRVPHSALDLEVMFHAEPVRAQIEKIITTSRNALHDTRPKVFTESVDGEYSAKYQTFARGHGPDGLILPRESGQSKFDQRSIEGIVVDANGPTGPALGRFINMAIGCDIRQDRVKGILKSVKSAVGQFSGRYPAIISVDISETVHNIQGASMGHLRDDICAILRNNTRISQVRLDSTVLQQEDGRDVYGSSSEIIQNPQAKYPLPAPHG